MTDIIETDRLSLRPLTPEDASAYFQVVNDYDVVKMTATWPWPVTEKYVQQRLLESQDRDQARNTGLGIYRGGVLIGNMGGHLEAHDVTGKEVIWIGYMLGRSVWGQGFMTEALNALCPYLWRKLGAVDMYGEHFFDNPASGRVMEKAGFAHVGAASEVWCKARQKHLSGEQYCLKVKGRQI
ncbi:MAG: GNAT family N-acetyltransferase [Aquisalinus sp.]|nr:GNAT family N-acetyltransferase [Aquisalinus sp.]